MNMNIKDYAKKINKEAIYCCYDTYIENTKEYEKITRYQMLASLYEVFTQEDALFHLLSYEEFLSLKECIKSPKKSANGFIDTKPYETLLHKFLVIYNFNELLVPNEIQAAVKATEQKYTEEDFRKKDTLNHLMIGILRCYGILTLTEFHMLCEKYAIAIPSIEEYYLTALYLHPYFSLYSRQDGSMLLVNEEIFDYIDEVIDIQNSHVYCVCDRKKDELLAIGTTGVNTNHPAIDTLYKILSESTFTYIENGFWADFFFAVHTCKDPANLIQWFDDLSIDDDMLTSLSEAVLDAYFNTPSAALFGCTPMEYMDYINEQSQESMQGNASLDENDTALFYDIYLALLEYTNKKYKIVKGLKKIYHRSHLEPEKMAKIRNFLFDHRNIIDDFIKKNPFQFDEEKLALIKDFKYAVKGMGIIIKYEADYTVISMQDDNFYAILGLTTNIDEVIPNEQLPYPVQITLLPWRNKIIYDGLLESYAIQVGKNMKKMIAEELANHHLITSIKPFQA